MNIDTHTPKYRQTQGNPKPVAAAAVAAWSGGVWVCRCAPVCFGGPGELATAGKQVN